MTGVVSVKWRERVRRDGLRRHDHGGRDRSYAARGSATRQRRCGADGGKLAGSHYRRRCTDGDALTAKHAVGRRNSRPARAPGECRGPARRMISRRPGRRELPVQLEEIHNAHWPGNSATNTAGKSSRPAGNHRALAFNFPFPGRGAQCGGGRRGVPPPPARPGGRTAGPGVAHTPRVPGRETAGPGRRPQ